MNIGLVLSGGMAKGAYQIGALRAIEKFVPKNEIKYMSCASVGVLNGYAYATDNLDCVEQMWKNICGDKSKTFITSVLKSNILQQDILELYDKSRQLSCAFYTSLLDINHRNLVYKDLREVASDTVPLYLKASVAMPIYNKSVLVDGTAYYDGAMIDNIPVFPILEHNLDYIICIYFDDTCYKFESAEFDKKVIKITFPVENMVKQSVVFKPDSIEDMLKVGYEKTEQLLKNVFANGYDDIEYILNYIEQGNKNTNNSLRITGDVLVTNLNKITQRLTKKKIL